MRSLADVSLSDLHALQRGLRSGRLTCPVRAFELGALGLGTHARDAVSNALAGLDASAAGAVLEILIAERTARTKHAELVWTGPEARQSFARDTAVVVQDLFDQAMSTVLIAGFRFDHGEQLLAPLHRAMNERAVLTRMFVHIQRPDNNSDPPGTLVRRFSRNFFKYDWPWPTPRPAIFYDPRTVALGAVHEGSSLHAKCVVVDGTRTLIGSANFTDRAQSRNIEAGALIHDQGFASRLEEQFLGLLSAGHFLPLPQG